MTETNVSVFLQSVTKIFLFDEFLFIQFIFFFFLKLRVTLESEIRYFIDPRGLTGSYRQQRTEGTNINTQWRLVKHIRFHSCSHSPSQSERVKAAGWNLALVLLMISTVVSLII